MNGTAKDIGLNIIETKGRKREDHSAHVASIAIRGEAIEHLKRAFPKEERVLVTGANGWIGRTASLMLRRLGWPLFLTGSTKRQISFGGESFDIRTFDIAEIADFAPTLLIDCAFITREHLADLSLEIYKSANSLLMEQAFDAFALQTVRAGVFFGSGAGVPKNGQVLSYEDNPYGFLKKQTEDLAKTKAIELNKRAVIVRPWSLSGTLATKVDEFAFSSFAKQSCTGAIRIRATHPVIRRYCSIDDLLAVSLFECATEPFGSTLVESGGDSITLSALAQLFVSSSYSDVQVFDEVNATLEANVYQSDNQIWTATCRRQNFSPESLSQQVSRIQNYFCLVN